MTSRSDSHTLALLDEAFGAAEGGAESHHVEQLTAGIAGGSSHHLTRLLNKLAAMAGLHVARAAYMSVVESFRYDLFSKWVSVATLQAVMENPADFDTAYASLQDDASRVTFDWFIHLHTAYSFIGEQALALYPASIARSDYARLISSLGKRTTQGYRVEKWTIDSDTSSIVDSVLLEQYRLAGLVEAERGDIVLDIGAYKGETALWFADRVGSQGLVLAMEPDARTSVILRRNVDRNRSAATAPIVVLLYAAGAVEGTARFIPTAGGCSVLSDRGETTVTTTAIDAVVVEQHLSRVDFIKMDIEGGEVDALKGAGETLKRFTPRLATSVYHRPRDLPDIIALVRQACPDYRFFLSHKSPGLAETVLFACCDAGGLNAHA